MCSAGGTLERHVAAAARNVAFRDQLSMSHHMLAPFFIIIVISVLIHSIIKQCTVAESQADRKISLKVGYVRIRGYEDFKEDLKIWGFEDMRI